ncbi:hypothetical protein, partial [Corallococcus sp. 4LFB]|uniref:hypothetical protein n=1 Tax=Corallococcus sp. 4LFB TaxID=3383249 RepID=UPI003976029B
PVAERREVARLLGRLKDPGSRALSLSPGGHGHLRAARGAGAVGRRLRELAPRLLPSSLARGASAARESLVQ